MYHWWLPCDTCCLCCGYLLKETSMEFCFSATLIRERERADKELHPLAVPPLFPACNLLLVCPAWLLTCRAEMALTRLGPIAPASSWKPWLTSRHASGRQQVTWSCALASLVGLFFVVLNSGKPDGFQRASHPPVAAGFPCTASVCAEDSLNCGPPTLYVV